MKLQAQQLALKEKIAARSENANGQKKALIPKAF